jgi:hypothetical protein
MPYLQVFVRAVKDQDDRVAMCLLEALEPGYEALGSIERVRIVIAYARFRCAYKVPSVDNYRDDITSWFLGALAFL